MNRNKQLRMWGTNLRGLATGGLQYGLGDEPDQARYNRMMEIAQELLDKTDDIDEEQAEGVAQKLMTKTPGLSEEDAMEMAYDLLGRGEVLSDEQVKTWGEELVAMAEIGVVEGHASMFDLNRYLAVKDMGQEMQK